MSAMPGSSIGGGFATAQDTPGNHSLAVPDIRTMFQHVMHLTAQIEDLNNRQHAMKKVMEENATLKAKVQEQAQLLAHLQAKYGQEQQQPPKYGQEKQQPPKKGLNQQQQAITGNQPAAAQQHSPKKGLNQQQREITSNQPTAAPTAATTPAPPIRQAAQTYAQAAGRPRPARTTARIAAAVRAFQEPTGPQGYAYVYLPSRNRSTRQTIRQKLRHLGVETNRVLDIHFPARHVTALLVHVQYQEQVLKILAEHSVAPVDFEPLDPANLHNEELRKLHEEERCNMAMMIHRDRMLRTLRYLRPSIAPSVGRYFVEQGWISEEERLKEIHQSAATHFRHADEDMASLSSNHSL